jgi:hypothetical protein
MKFPTAAMALIGFSMALGAAPAGAQPGPPPGQPTPNTGQNVVPPPDVIRSGTMRDDPLDGPDYSLRQREDRLAARLAANHAEGSLSPGEYARDKAELADIQTTEDRLRRRNNGELTDSETFRLEGRLKTLAATLH